MDAYITPPSGATVFVYSLRSAGSAGRTPARKHAGLFLVGHFVVCVCVCFF